MNNHVFILGLCILNLISVYLESKSCTYCSDAGLFKISNGALNTNKTVIFLLCSPVILDTFLFF